MKINKIIFSPTGGTKKVADIIAKELGNEDVEIDLSDPKENFSQKLSKDDLAIIALPSFGGRAPKVAMERLRKIKGDQTKCILVAVYGNRDFEDTLIEMFDLVKENDFIPVGAISAVAEHSIFPQYASGRPDKEDERELAELVKEIKSNNFSEITKIPGNRPYRKISKVPLTPKPNKECSKCSACVVVCPVEAIDSENFKSDKKKCIACMRCLHICPANARSINGLLSNVAAAALKKETSHRKSNELYL